VSSDRLADWIDPDGGPCLRWEPWDDGTLWTRSTETSDDWSRYSGEAPTAGWRHV